MKHKKVLIILSAIAALLLVFAYLIFAAFNGSIVRRVITTVKAKDYVAENYPGEPYDVDFCHYDFKMGGYFCVVQSRESEDTRFTVWDDSEGMRDDFDIWVMSRQATLSRLSRAMDDYTEDLMSRIYPYRTSLVLCDVLSGISEDEITDLPLDLPFDPMNFPLPMTLTVWTETTGEEPTWEEMAERLRELEALTRDELPNVENYSMQIQEKYVEGEYSPGICAFDVPRKVILGDGLEEYLAEVKAAQDAEQEAIEKGENPGKMGE